MAKLGDTDQPIGPIVFANMSRLGFTEEVPKLSEVARLIEIKTGESISRQRISQILNAVTAQSETIELIAKGMGVDLDELIRPPGKKNRRFP